MKSRIAWLASTSFFSSGDTKHHLCPRWRLSAEGGHDKIAKMLVAKGANINARRTDGTTPLSAALHRGHQQIVKLLLRNGAEFITTVGSCGGGSQGNG